MELINWIGGHEYTNMFSKTVARAVTDSKPSKDIRIVSKTTSDEVSHSYMKRDRMLFESLSGSKLVWDEKGDFDAKSIKKIASISQKHATEILEENLPKNKERLKGRIQAVIIVVDLKFEKVCHACAGVSATRESRKRKFDSLRN